jgi:hypothetical protein
MPCKVSQYKDSGCDPELSHPTNPFLEKSDSNPNLKLRIFVLFSLLQYFQMPIHVAHKLTAKGLDGGSPNHFAFESKGS